MQVRKKIERYVTALLVIISIFFGNVMPVMAEEDKTTIKETEIYARSAVLMDADSGRILYAKHAQDILPMASTTKIMTLIVTLENANLEDMVTVSKYAASMPDVQLNIRAGEQYVLKDLLYSLMLESHNDSAVAIAEHVGGSVDGFTQLMNQKARDLGCEKSYFLTPNGLDATKDGKPHATTAEELARIMAYCIKKSPQKELFLEITRTPNFSFCNKVVRENGTIENGGRSFSCRNHNAFLNMMEGALSGKTGFTGNAGYCYVGALERMGKTFIVALLACGWPNNKGYKWSDTRKLMEYGLTNYEYYPFAQVKLEEAKLQPIPVSEGQTDKIGETAYTGISLIEAKEGIKGSENTDGVLLRKDESIETVYQQKKALQAPIKAGELLGTISYQVEGTVFLVKQMVATESVERIDYRWCFEKIMEKFLLR